MGDLLAEEVDLVQPNTLYRCLDKVVKHKQELFSFLQNRWRDLFNAEFDILLYDLTSTYFESDPPDHGKIFRAGDHERIESRAMSGEPVYREEEPFIHVAAHGKALATKRGCHAGNKSGHEFREE